MPETMAIDSTQSTFLVAPQDYVPGGGSLRIGPGTAGGSVPLDEDLGPASVNVAAKGGAEEFSFGDVLDAINPLHHIPVVGTLYRAMTGDEIGPVARVAGGTLYGGPVGAGMAVANLALEQATGGDLGDHVMAMVTGDKVADPAPTQIALAAESTAPAPVARQAEAASASVSAVRPAPPTPPASQGTARALGRIEPAAGAAVGAQGAAQQALPVNQQALGTLGVGRDVPQLSPAAFQMLMNSIGAKPVETAESPAPKPASNAGSGLASGAEAEPASRPVVPAAAMEVHKLLQGFANQRQ